MTQKYYVAYANLEQTVIIEFIGILTQSEEEANQLIQKELEGIVNQKLGEHDFKIYWKERESPPTIKFTEQYKFYGNAVAIYTEHSLNRKPQFLEKKHVK